MKNRKLLDKKLGKVYSKAVNAYYRAMVSSMIYDYPLILYSDLSLHFRREMQELKFLFSSFDCVVLSRSSLVFISKIKNLSFNFISYGNCFSLFFKSWDDLFVFIKDGLDSITNFSNLKLRAGSWKGYYFNTSAISWLEKLIVSQDNNIRVMEKKGLIKFLIILCNAIYPLLFILLQCFYAMVWALMSLYTKLSLKFN